ncbi:MAG: protein phosphatase 2C domain-containing protein [Chitinophagales bacterium]|nr:protein phosphatase 2C domain-containing protein [Chitinophagales bacterium]
MNLIVEYIHEVGQRANNEDYLLINSEKNFYFVCDGVGGSNKGEEASQLAANSFNNFLNTLDSVSNEELKKALKYTEQAFDKFVEDNPESYGMATTLTFLFFDDDNNAMAAHCGDSRIYQIRDGEIIFKTKDHSFIQELVDGGYITAELAKVHPKRNQITRAIKGSNAPTQLAIAIIDNIQENDFFLLCSDGILESIDDEYITQNFKKNRAIKSIKDNILELCNEHSKDNFTAILLQYKKENLIQKIGNWLNT